MRSKLIPLVLAHAAKAGVDASALADRFGVPDGLRDPEAWSMDAPALTIPVGAALCDAVADALGDPLLGLSVAAGLPRGTYGVLEFAARNAPTLDAAAGRLVRFHRLINDAVVYELERTPRSAAIVHRVPGFADGVGRHGNLFTVAILERICRELVGELEVQRVDLAHMKHADPASLAAVLEVPDVRFGTGRNALVLARADLERPVLEADGALLMVLDGYAGRLLPADPGRGWSARIRDHLVRTLSGGAPTLEETATHFHTSARNLQRQLAEEGSSYSSVLGDLREEQARHLLADPGIALGEVAFLLGYSETRALLRAFKRWTGTSPQRYRLALA